MNGTRRTGSSLTGRPLRDKLLGETRQLADVVDRLSASDEPHDLEHQSLEHDVSASLETINKVTETYGVLLDKLSAYELRVRDLTRKLSEEERVTGDALRAAARHEETARDAQTRASRAEAEAERSAENVRELERQLVALRGQTAKLMDAVDQLFPDLDEGAAERPRGLRVVR